MKRIRLLSALTALLLPVASTAFAQDGEPSPEAGDVGSEMGGDMSAGGDASATPSGDSAAPSSDDPAKPISVGLLVGYGISLEDGANPWGIGFGARGGYNLGQIYLGARFVFYLGESESSMPIPGGASVDSDFNIWELGIEGGYDLKAGDALTIRPELGIGIASLNVSVGSFSDSSTDLYLAPGASILYDVTDSVFLGVDARFQIVLADETAKSIILLANGGMRF
jgi:opacity protein-like surface antigen